MEALVNKKKNLVEGIVNATLRMRDSCRTDNYETFADRLSDRMRLFDELKKCDDALAGTPTSYDSFWHSEFLRVQKMDVELAAFLEKTQKVVGNKLSQLQEVKSELIQLNEINPKGRRIAAKA